MTLDELCSHLLPPDEHLHFDTLLFEDHHLTLRLSGSNGAKMYANASSLLDTCVVTAARSRTTYRCSSRHRSA